MNDQSLDQRSRFGRGFGVLLILLLVALGSAAVSYNLGLTRGLAQAGVAAGGALAPPPYYGYYYYPHPWGFGLFGPFFLVLFFFVAVRGLLWRGSWHRGWRGGPYSSMSRLDEWHRQAHQRMKDVPPVGPTAGANS